MEELEKTYYTLVYKAYMNKEVIFKLIEKPEVKEYLKLLDRHMILDYELKKTIKNNLNNYYDIKEELTNINIRIDELNKDSLIIEYKDRMEKQTVLDYELKKADFNLKKRMYLECDHFFVKHNQYKNGKTQYCCLKCGFDAKLKANELIPISDYEYQSSISDINGTFIQEFTDLELANKIYEGIIKMYPDISIEKLAKYFSVARHFILEKGEKNYDKHAKHLGLKKQRC